MSIKVKGFIQISWNKERGLIPVSQIEALTEVNGENWISVQFKPQAFVIDQSYDEVCALIKEAQE
jgi:hypothetical protein